MKKKADIKAKANLYINGEYVYFFTTTAKAKFTSIIAKASKYLREQGIEILSDWVLKKDKATYVYEAKTSKGVATLAFVEF